MIIILSAKKNHAATLRAPLWLFDE